MPSKTLKIDSTSATVAILAYGTSENAITQPYSYLSSLYFHSGLNNIQIKAKVSAPIVTFPAIAQGMVYWDDGSKGCGGGCYITTAIVDYMGLGEADILLIILRGYRDTYMSSTIENRQLVDEYYNTAPSIVTALLKHKDSKRIFTMIYSKYLLVAAKAILMGKNEEALRIYKAMYLKLKNLVGV